MRPKAEEEAEMCHSKITRTQKNGEGELEFLVVRSRGKDWTAQESLGTPLSLEDKKTWLISLRKDDDLRDYILDDTGIND